MESVLGTRGVERVFGEESGCVSESKFRKVLGLRHRAVEQIARSEERADEQGSGAVNARAANAREMITEIFILERELELKSVRWVLYSVVPLWKYGTELKKTSVESKTAESLIFIHPPLLSSWLLSHTY